MNELLFAAHCASEAFHRHWLRGFIEASHGVIRRQRSERMFRAHVDQQFQDIEDVVRSSAIIKI
ncbi:hypothetical protein [Bradyrhizobium elkanii]|uniref:hypothetical protein n=1 Tax=Bradyrhizobium elkanii TaxID=29448 RepID=UPI0035149E38